MAESKNIILFQPKAGTWDYIGARLPEALLSISALPIKEDYKVTIIDQRLEDNWKEKLISELKKEPIIFGTTCMTGPQISYATEVSKIVKEFNKDIPVMWGGIHPTLLPLQTLKHPNVDIVIFGDGEFPFINLIHTLEKKGDLKEVKGIGFKNKEGKITINPKEEILRDLDILPDLPYHLVDVKKYYAMNFRNRPSISITTSRGCPYRCTFCIDPAISKGRWSAYSSKRVLEKMKFIIDTYGIKDFYFSDDNFGTNPTRVKEILRGIVKEFDDVVWGTLGVRADAICRMDQEYQELLVKSGCKNMDMGVESGSPRILQLMKKDETVEVFPKANKILANLGITTKCTFVIGYPTETREDLQKTKELALQLMKENPRAYVLFCTFCPYVGSEAYDLAIQHGFIPPKTLEEWAIFDFEGWYKKNPAWLNKKQQKIIENLSFTAQFINKNIRYKIENKTARLIFDLYHPMARFRFSKDFFYMPIEKKLCNTILG